LDLNGCNQSISGLLATGTLTNADVVNSNSNTGTLNVNISSGTNTFGGVIGTEAQTQSGTPVTGTNLALTKTGAGVLVLAGANGYRGPTAVSAGKLVLASTSAFPANTSLNIASGALVQIANHGIGNAFVPTISSLSNSGSIDIGNNAMVIHNGNLTTVAFEIANGCNGGLWNGSSTIAGVIFSSTAASDTTHLTAVGVATGLTNFQGGSVLPSDVLVKYTYYGDANLDGQVSSADYTLIDAGYLSRGTLTGWNNGDFNYDGVINGSDYTLIDNAFNMQGAELNAQVASPSALETAQTFGGSSSVPEPTGLELLGMSAAGLLRRRRRWSSARTS
jgi:autotransporter-associated beta strand protein